MSPAGSHVPGPPISGTHTTGTGTAGTPRHHIVTAMVENKAGVLARVASLFSRRGFNIFSLAVAPTDDVRFSRITIVVDVESAPLEQIMKQLDKLVNVVSITELAPHEAVERELLLVTLATGNRAPASGPAPLADVVHAFDASIVDETTDQVTVMLAGTPGRIDEFEELLRPFGITELQRTGLVALPKLSPVSVPTPT
ncbi:MAG TPA: acetolactate synthase small subunit [Acidimicrobiales bacterium]